MFNCIYKIGLLLIGVGLSIKIPAVIFEYPELFAVGFSCSIAGVIVIAYSIFGKKPITMK